MSWSSCSVGKCDSAIQPEKLDHRPDRPRAMNRTYHLAGQIADVALREARAENVRVDAEHVDGVAPELIFVGIIFHREGYAGRVILLDQAVLMECPRLPLACALVTSVIADDARIAGQSFGVLSDHLVRANVSRSRPSRIRAHLRKKRAYGRQVEDAERLHRLGVRIDHIRAAVGDKIIYHQIDRRLGDRRQSRSVVIGAEAQSRSYRTGRSQIAGARPCE